VTLAPEARGRRSLPMLGRTHGRRSAVTCQLKCADACAHPVPNPTDSPSFRDVASTALSRRALLGGAGGGVLAMLVGQATTGAGGAAAAGGPGRAGALGFTAIDPVPATVDAVTVPDGFTWRPVIRWGDPILRGAPGFDIDRQTPEAQAGQFGYNNDYLDIIGVDGANGRKALLVANHEYTNENLMFGVVATPESDAAEHARQSRIAMAAHGLSVVELRRRSAGEAWEYESRSHLNRRITVGTEFRFDGPAAGSALLRTAADPSGTRPVGTLNNCAGGTTPWGTVLSGEENVNGYFATAADTAELKRYGFGTATVRRWEAVDPRFDARNPGYENEPNRFGWVVEVDPFEPDSTPVKHTALGRLKHEGASVQVAPDGRVVAYMGDDERFDYVYKFVSRERMRPGGSTAARRHNKTLLQDGDLYVARFSGDGPVDGVSDGPGEWIPLVENGESKVPGFSVERVLVFTRLAADAVAPTRMDRPEDVQPNPATGRVYIACTNNTRRTAAEVANKDGHVIELIEDGDDATATTFTWNLLLVCGDEATAGTYFGGWTGPVSPISCPDNVAFDSAGDLWISTDGQPGTIARNDGLFRVPLEGPERGRVQQFLAVPRDAETCGPVVHDRDGSVFVAVQHPGEDGSYAAPRSYFPDYAGGRTPRQGEFAGPRPAVIQVLRER
jgi:secreted PhoX family phosphatase